MRSLLISSRGGFMFAFAFTAVAALVLGAAAVDPVSADEAALAKHIKTLESPEVAAREAAAASIRAIVAKYPSGTVNIREADGGASRWKGKLAEVKPGISEAEALRILSPLDVLGEFESGAVVPGREAPVITYQLDEHWAGSIMYLRTDPAKARIVMTVIDGVRVADRIVVPKPPPGFSGRWPVWYSNGVPGPSEASARDGRVFLSGLP
jgi:hypothetical protein